MEKVAEEHLPSCGGFAWCNTSMPLEQRALGEWVALGGFGADFDPPPVFVCSPYCTILVYSIDSLHYYRHVGILRNEGCVKLLLYKPMFLQDFSLEI